MTHGSAEQETTWNLTNHVQYIIVPLPAKVYLSAEKAETASWNEIKDFAQSVLPQMVLNLNVQINQSSSDFGGVLSSSFAAGELLAQFYPTYGWKYKHRALRNDHHGAFKALVRATDLPRFVYVTEFSTLQMIENKALLERRVISHCVIDATAKNTGKEAVLIFHAPGFVRRRIIDSSQNRIPSVSFLADDNLYFPKLRGEPNFDKFRSP